ncbi:MAG: PTS sugar transporter subunit IIA [Bacteroidota bacterium]
MTDTTRWMAEENIDLELSADSELETITAMLELARNSGAVKDIKQLAQALLQHEVLSPSPSGCCAVVFQAVSEAASYPHMFFGRFDKGIGYYSRNGRPVDLIVLMIAPPKNADELASMIDEMKRMLSEPSVREQLRSVQTKQKALTAFLRGLSNIQGRKKQ